MLPGCTNPHIVLNQTPSWGASKVQHLSSHGNAFMPTRPLCFHTRLPGRGTLDVKSGVVGLLEAATALLDGGYTPERTLMMAFGQDEESGGFAGAAHIAGKLCRRCLMTLWICSMQKRCIASTGDADARARTQAPTRACRAMLCLETKCGTCLSCSGTAAVLRCAVPWSCSQACSSGSAVGVHMGRGRCDLCRWCAATFTLPCSPSGHC